MEHLKTPPILTAPQVAQQTRESSYLPQTLSETRTLTNVSSLDARTVKFTYSISGSAKSLTDEAAEKIKQELLDGTCSPGEQLDGLNAGLRSVHSFIRAEDGKTLASFLIEEADCQ